ncbi:MAG: type 4a pilus biogenesis protein PilO [Chitinivibrionales bacterium]
MYSEIIKRAKNEYISVVLFALSIFFCVYITDNMLIPEIIRYTKLNAKLERLRDIESDAGVDQTLRDSLLIKQKRLRQELRGYVSETEGIVSFSDALQKLFNLAWEAGFKFDKTSPGSAEESGDFTEYPVVLEAETDFKKFAEFITSVENMPAAFSINGVGSRTQRYGDLQVRVSISCFIRKGERR